MTKLTIVASALLAFGCSAMSSPERRQPPPMAREATEQQVEHCEFLGTVYGGDSWGTIFTPGANARAATAKMLRKAGKHGATHVVVESAQSGWGGIASAQGKAYRCPAPAGNEKVTEAPEPSGKEGN